MARAPREPKTRALGISDDDERLIPWVDLSAVGVVLGRLRVNDAWVFCAVDSTGKQRRALEVLGFAPERAADGTTLEGIYLAQHPVTPRKLAEVFGADHVKQIDMTPARIDRALQAAREIRMYQARFERASAEAASKKPAPSGVTHEEDKGAVPIGMNYAGAIVWQSEAGRYFDLQQHGSQQIIRVREKSVNAQGQSRRETNAAAFLYVDHMSDLPKVADGFVTRALKGERLTKKHFDQLVEVTSAQSSAYRLSRHDYQEAIEGAVIRAFSKQAVERRGNFETLFRLAIRLYEGIPSQKERTASSVSNQQFSTPLPISLVGQRLLGPTTGASVIDPAIGNRSLVSALDKDTVIYGVEIDPQRIHAFGASNISGVEKVVVGDATTIDFRDEFDERDGFDFVIANPPFGGLQRAVRVPVESPLTESIETKRLDHWILLRSLAARSAGGRSVYIVAADDTREEGAVKGRSKWLMNYLYDHYDVEGVVDIAGNLYQKMGAAYPIRMIVVGARKATPVRGEEAPDTLPVLRTHEEIKEWAAQILERRMDAVAPAAEATGKEPSDSAVAAVIAVATAQKKQATKGFAPAGKGQERTVAEGAAPQLDPGKRIAATEATAAASSEEVTAAAVEAILEADPGADAAAEEGVERVDEQDEYQTPYKPFSKIGEATTMIPVNLAAPVYAALAAVTARYGDIDEFVSSELDFSVNELGTMFSPEQIDVLALSIAAKKNGKGFLLGDKMGVGKGRVLAAMARYARLNGEIPVFLTHKSNLFSDFFERDLPHVKSRHLFKAPFIFNADVKIVDGAGVVTHTASRPPAFKRCFDSGAFPEGTDIVLATYSQFSRQENRSNRAKLLQDVSMQGNLAFLLDESHNGAGDSNTSDNLCTAIANNASPVLFASGTPIKGAKNLRVYSQILPSGLDYGQLLEVIAQDPLCLQEALTHEIAASGCLISRELDNRDIKKEFSIAPDVERNRKLSDQVAEILMAMSYLAGDVNNIVNARRSEIRQILRELPEDERVGNRMNVSSMNFGSRFHAISRQFLLAVKADQCVQEALAALERDEKPIVALQHTGESLIAAALAKARRGDQAAGDDDDEADEHGTAVVLNKQVVLERPISFKDLLLRYIDRILWIKEQGAYGDVSYHRADSKEIMKAVKQITELVMRLPDDLSLTPIDYFKHRMEQRGYKVGEITGRSLAVRYLQSGGVLIESVNNTDKSKVVKTCREFNNGELDAVVLTASGSTGISLHASPANGKDVRRRVMVKWEPQQDIVVERQVDGRPNRNGQLLKPRYRVLLSGLPADDRQAMMFNNKNRSLTAATVANRDSDDLIRVVPDLLNEVGDKVAEEMFYANPELATMMDVDLSYDEEEERYRRPENYYINRMTGRIMLLTYDSQVKLLRELENRFNDRIEELNAKGENPLVMKCHDWRAEVLTKEVFLGEEVQQPASGAKKTAAGAPVSSFGEPVYLTRIEYEKELTPMPVPTIDALIASGAERLLLGNWKKTVASIVNAVHMNYDRWLKESVSVYRYKSGETAEALKAEESNETKKLKEKLDWLLASIEHLGPGGIFYIEEENGELVPHIVARVELPVDDQMKRLGEWGVYAARLGDDHVQSMSMNKLFAHKVQLAGSVFKSNALVREQFDKCPRGKVRVQELVLNGNIFEAVATAIRHKLGKKVMYTDAAGVRQHGVVVRRGISAEKLRTVVAERLRSSAEILWYLDLAADAANARERGLSTDQDGRYDADDSVRIVKRDGEYRITVPGTKIGGGHIFLDPKIAAIKGKRVEGSFKLAFEGNRTSMSAFASRERMSELLDYLMKEKSVWFYAGNKEILRDARAAMKAGVAPAAEAA